MFVRLLTNTPITDNIMPSEVDKEWMISFSADTKTVPLTKPLSQLGYW